MMFSQLKKIDTFSRNILLVFSGASLLSFFNLLCQLLLAHKLSPADFAGFNALLAIFTLVATPIGTLQIAVAKYTAEFNGRRQTEKIIFLCSDFLGKALILSGVTFIILRLFASRLMLVLHIQAAASSGFIFAALVASLWLMPVLSGGVQGLESFGWLSAASVISGIVKLSLTFIFLLLGYGIGGALGAFLVSNLAIITLLYFALKSYLKLKPVWQEVRYKEILLYLLPVAACNFFFINLLSSDMILVRYFFSRDESGWYALAQMVGKIFLFLPAAISIVMFPKISGLEARNIDSLPVLKKSLFYSALLCLTAAVFYNLFPAFILKLLTGKETAGVIMLGRLFSISMTFFALLSVLIFYFLSRKDFRFLKYLILFTLWQILAISLFHQSLILVQLIICLNAFLLFGIHLRLVYTKKGLSSAG